MSCQSGNECRRNRSFAFEDVGKLIRQFLRQLHERHDPKRAAEEFPVGLQFAHDLLKFGKS